jgi:cytidine deaminase
MHSTGSFLDKYTRQDAVLKKRPYKTTQVPVTEAGNYIRKISATGSCRQYMTEFLTQNFMTFH